MRRQDREAMRGKTQEGRRSDGEQAAPEFEDRQKREKMRGDATAAERERPSPQRPSGRLPLPD